MTPSHEVSRQRKAAHRREILRYVMHDLSRMASVAIGIWIVWMIAAQMLAGYEIQVMMGVK